MSALLTLLLPAIAPAAMDILKNVGTGVTQKLFGGTKPVSVAEQIQLMQAETERLKAVAELDKPSENISPWVANLRGSFRYIAAAAIIIFTFILTLIFVFMTYSDPKNTNIEYIIPFVDMFAQLSASVFSFMFGDRVYIGLKNTTAGKK